MSLDGSTLDVADEKANEEAFTPAGSESWFQRISASPFCVPVENGTYVLFGTQMDSYRTGGIVLAKAVLRA